MLVPWLKNPACDSCASGAALTVPSAPAVIFSIYREEKQSQNAALKLLILALVSAKEFSCAGECLGSDKDSGLTQLLASPDS